MSSARRVVVTGLGVISPLGNSVETLWQSLRQGKSGVRLIDTFDTSGLSVRIAGLVRDFDPTQYGIEVKEARKMDPFIQYGVASAMQALENAGIPKNPENPSRYGVIFGSGIGGLETIEATKIVMMEQGARRVSPFFIPSTIINMIAGYISIAYGLKGLNLAVATACTTGAHAIGLAQRLIRSGDADVIVAGGAEKASTLLGMAGFAAAKALSGRNDDPEAASRPWDKDRDGFILGDGAGTLVLESYEHAVARGAHIYAELVGFGMSGDAYHITKPSGEGAVSAMQAALKDAGCTPEDIQYINAHGTSTPAGDLAESNAVKEAFGAHAHKLLMSSTKSMMGHLLGAAGAVEALICVLALQHQMVPPTINLENPEEGCDLDYVPNKARAVALNAVMSNSFGFGGTNGSLIFKQVG